MPQGTLDQRTHIVMERRILGRGEIQTWSLTFDGDKVTVNSKYRRHKAELRGEMSE